MLGVPSLWAGCSNRKQCPNEDTTRSKSMNMKDIEEVRNEKHD